MPGLTSLLVSLSEVLESQGQPCKELEIWALLCQCAERLQDLIIKGEAVSLNGFQYMLTPNNLLFKDNGNIVIGAAPESFQGSLYMAPEYDSFSVQNLSETAFEKMFVYSLGRTLQVASEFGLKHNEVLNISYDLHSLLQTMTERNATVRIGLIHILEACALQSTQHSSKPSPSHILSHLYKTVLDSEHKTFSWDSSHGSDCSGQNQLYERHGRVRRPRPKVRHGRTLGHSFSSRSRSRSGSHSPSRSRHHESEQGFGGSRLNERPRIAAKLPTTSILGSHANFLYRPVTSSIPSSSASHSIQGISGLRQESQAFQKYVQLKERQVRLQKARNGKTQSGMENVKSTLMSQEFLDKTSETVSMTSLMSYTLGSYMPYLHNQLEVESPIMYGRDYETDVESVPDSQRSLDQGQGDREEMCRAATEHDVSHVNTPSMSAEAFNPPKIGSVLSKEGSPNIFGTGKKYISSKVEPEFGKRKYLGPEYVHMATKPVIKVAMPFQNNMKSTTHIRLVTVVHLTGQKLEITLDPGITGRQLLDAVISYTDLDDFLFFGLTYISDGEHFFLDDDTKLHKIAPEGWKEGSKTPNSSVSFTLFVRVKFYPDSLTDFRHKSSIHLLYLQLRQDIVEGNIECEDLKLHKLIGLALQMEYGDYAQMSCTQTYFQVEQYVPKAAIRKLGSSFIYKRIAEEHEACCGTCSSDAELAFIKQVRQLPDYGIHFYKLFKFKSQMNEFVWLGLSQYNLVLSEVNGSKRTVVQAYPWNRVLKISFNKRRFSIQPNVEVSKGKPPKLNFYTNSHRKGRYMLQFSTDLHRFQIRMRTRSSNMETFTGDMRSDGGRLHVDTDVGHDNGASASAPIMTDPSHQPLPHDEDGDDDEEIEEENYRPVYYKLPHPYESPPPYQPPSMVQALVDRLILSGMNEIALDAHVANSNNTAWNYPEVNKILETSFRTTSMGSSLASERSAEEEVLPLVSSKTLLLHPHSARHIFKVILVREEKLGIGLTIVGGETTNSLDLGIFIKSVAPGGPAARDGRVKPGDRLIAIDGLSLEGKQHHEAVALIRDAGPKVELLISQIRPPGTLRQTNNSNDQANFENITSNVSERIRKNISLLPETDRVALEKSLHSETQACFDYVDLLKEAHIDLMSSDACMSDEDNCPITCNSTPPPPALPTQPPPTGSSIMNFPDRYQQPSFCHTDAMRSSAHDKPVGGISHPQYFSFKYENQVKNNEALDQVFCELPADYELSYRLGSEWSNCTEDHNTCFCQGRLTEEEKEDIQILGDIAALDVEASSSDSDFDTAVKNTLEGSGLNKHSKSSSDGFSIKALKNPTRNNLQDVIYEVVLEMQSGPHGIVIQNLEHSKDSAEDLYIKEISHGSSAHLGGILAPGDKLIEIQGQCVANMSLEEVYAALESAKEFCAVKISRSIYSDDKMTHEPGIKHQLKNDSGLESGLTHFTEHAGSLSFDWKHENMKTIPIQSSPSLPKSHRSPSYAKETTKSQDIDLNTDQAPPTLILGAEDSESNTESDVDSDVLDSSRSELEDTDKCSQQCFGDKPEESLRAGWNESEALPQTDERKLSCLKYQTCNIEINMDAEADESKVKNYVELSLKDSRSRTTVIPDETYLSEKDVPLIPSWNSSSKDITNNLDEIDTDPVKSVKEDDFSSKEKIAHFQVKETVNKTGKILEWDKNENGNIKDLDDTIDKLPGGGLQDAERDVTHSELEGKMKGFEEDGNNKSEVPQRQKYYPELVEATLIREPGGSFGFTIAGDLTTGGCYIKHLVSSPLAQYGTLFPGDKLLMVNSEDTTSLNHTEAVSLLRNGPDEVKLKLLRYPSSMQTQENLLMLKKLTKKKREEDMDFDLVRNISNALDSHSSVHNLIKSSEKKTDRTIFEPYENEQTRKETFATESLRNRVMSLSEDITDGTVEVPSKMREGTILKSQSKKTEEIVGTECTPEEKFEVLKIELRKPSEQGSNLGISLVDREIDGQSMIVIKRLKPNGIAHRDGRLQPGDRLLQANNMPLEKVKAQEAVEILRKAKDRVLLTLSRQKDISQIIGSESTRNVDGLYENFDLVDSPKDCLAAMGPEASNFSDAYTSCRTLHMTVPAILNNEWLADLPLISLPEPRSGESNAASILQSLVDMLERGEPAEEFKNIRQTKGDKMCSAGQLPENKLKNRYRNILPYDANRVKLMNAVEGDYINASHISISLSNINDTFRYIVCQGPLEETVDDFWTMLWQEKVNVIAMLTQAVERDKIKCHVYWPQRKEEPLIFGESRLQIKLIRSYELQSFDVIQLAVEETHTGTERKLTILQYTRWPDQGVPDTALPILQLLQVLHLFENGQPPLIHCSSGVGRTGVVTAIDIALACIEKGIKFDLYQIVRTLRWQRQGMIQTTDQYAFCYTACMEAILSDELQET